jgi:transcriptional regulator with XRE-family HTH domain
MTKFADNLKRRAEILGISNAEVARRAGLTERRYGNYVTGRREPDLNTLIRISVVLGVTPNDLLLEKAKGKLSKENVLIDKVHAAAQSMGLPEIQLLAVVADALAGRKPGT